MKYVYLLTVILLSCYEKPIALDGNGLPLSTVSCRVFGNQDDLNSFFFFKDDSELLANEQIFLEVQFGTLMHLYASDSALGSYEIVGKENNLVIIESYFPIPPMISWKPEIKRYYMELQKQGIRIFKDCTAMSEPIIIKFKRLPGSADK